jgi:hypothetical protein
MDVKDGTDKLPAALVFCGPSSRQLRKEFGEDKAGRQAAALAYYTLFSLVPLLFVAVAVTAITLGPPRDALPLDPRTGQVDCTCVTNDPLPRLRPPARPSGGAVGRGGRRDGERPGAGAHLSGAGERGASLSLGLALAAFAASGIFLQVQGS